MNTFHVIIFIDGGNGPPIKEVNKAPNKEDKIMTTFTINGTVYESNEKGNYFYKSTGKMDKKGNPIMMRISQAVYEQAFDQYVKEAADVAEAQEPMDWEREADAEYEERLQKQAESDRAAEEAVNKKTSRKDPHRAIDKEMKKTRRSKDVAFEYCPNGTDTTTLTAKQVQFLKLLPKTCFWEEGVESTLWCDILADEIGGQFAGKPMTVGAMISTLREKGLVNVSRDLDRKGHPKFMVLTDMGKQVATELGLE
jgi:DNA-binding MarR family transcriptional regulator